MQKSAKIHFIGIGHGSMADLAIALTALGHVVTGSDEKIGADILAKLQSSTVVTGAFEWNQEKISSGLDAVIVGTIIKSGNPELMRAQELKLTLFSFPEYIFRQAIDKQRLVITGSYGKTTIILMIIHVLNFHKRKFDYVLIDGSSGKLASNVKLSSAPLIIIEGQDVITPVIDRVPAFLKYHHHIGVISGIEWQESDTYPTKEEYTRQFGMFGASTPKGGTMIYFELDPVVAVLSGVNQQDATLVPYKTHATTYDGNNEFLITPEKQRIPLKITGKHNLQSISAAREVVKKIGITSEMFYEAISSFEGVGH